MQAGLDYQIADGLTVGINVSYDEAFETRVSGNIEYRFGSNSAAAETKKKAWQKPTIQALSESVKNRNIRVHDAAGSCKVYLRNGKFAGSVPHSGFMQDPWAKWHCSPGAKDATANGWEPA